MKQNINSLVTAIATMFFGCLYAQEPQVSSLLSNIGLGTTFAEATVTEKAQGDLSVVSNNNEETISFANPALLSDLQLTSFGASLQVLGAKVSAPNVDLNNTAVAVSNLFFGVPLGVKGGFVLGVRSHSVVGFEVNSDDFYNSGNGAVNQFYTGLGYELVKDLSLGAQANMHFGETTKKQVFKNVQKSTVLSQSYNVKGVTIKIGTQYKRLLYKNVKGYVGAYGILNNNITADGTERFYEAIQIGEKTFNEVNTASTISKSISGSQKNPFKSVFGVGLGAKNHWFAGVSYENQGAVAYSGQVFNQTTNLPVAFEASSKVSIGGYIIPKKYSLKNYLNKIAYRAGFKYENTGLVLNNNTVKNIGMSLGMGLPIGRKNSYANFSLELGKLGDESENKYQENYINIGINFSLSDKWFNKRVIN